MADHIGARIAPNTAISTIGLEATNSPWSQATLAVVEVNHLGEPTIRARNTVTGSTITVEATGTWSPSPGLERYAILFEGNPTDAQLTADLPEGVEGHPPPSWGAGVQIDISGGYFGVLSGYLGNNLMALAARTASSNTPDDVNAVWAVRSPEDDHLYVIISRADDELPSGSDHVVAAWTKDRYIIASAAWQMVESTFPLCVANLDALDPGDGFEELEEIGVSAQTPDDVRCHPRVFLETELDPEGTTLSTPTGVSPSLSFVLTFDENDEPELAIPS